MSKFFTLRPELQTKIFSYFEEDTLLDVRLVCKSFKSIIENNVGLDCTLEGYAQSSLGCCICPGKESEDLYPKLKFFMVNNTFVRRLTINRWYPEKDLYPITVIRKLIREPDKLEWVTLRRLEMNFLYETLNCTRQTLVHLTHISVTDITTLYNMQKIIHEQKYKNPIYMEQLRTFNLRLEFSTDEHDFLESFYLLLLIKAPNLQELGIIAEYTRRHDNLQLDMTCNLLGFVAHFLGSCEKLKQLWIWKNHIGREKYRCSSCRINDRRDQNQDRVEDNDLHSSTKIPTKYLEEVVKCANIPHLNEMMTIKDTEKKLEYVREMFSQIPVTSLESLNVRMGTPRESLIYNGLIGNQKELKELKVQLDYISVGSDENPPWKQVVTNMVEPVKETIENLGLTARFKKTVDLAATFRGYNKLKSLHLWHSGGSLGSRGDRQHNYSDFQYHVRWLPPKKLYVFADKDLGLQEYPFIDAHECSMVERNEYYEDEDDDEEEEDGVEEEDEDGVEEEVEDGVEEEEEIEADDDDEEEEMEEEVDADEDGDVDEEVNEANGEDMSDEEEDNIENEQDDDLDREREGIRPIYSSDEEDSDSEIMNSQAPDDVEIKLHEISNTLMEIQLFPNLVNLHIADSFPALENLSLTYMTILPSEFSNASLSQFENLKSIDIDMGGDVTHDVFGIELRDLVEYTKLRKLNKLRILPIKRPGKAQGETVRRYFRRMLDDTGRQLVQGVLEMPAAYY